MGGYHAINIADLLQGTIMVTGAVLMVFFLVNTLGGFGEATKLQKEKYWEHYAKPGVEQVQQEKNLEPDTDQNDKAPAKDKKPAPPWWILFSLVILTSLGPWGLPQMVQKYYAIRTENLIPKIIIVCTIFAIIISFVAYYSGSLTHVFFSPGKEEVLETANGSIDVLKIPMTGGEKPAPDFDAFIPQMLQKHTPGWLNIAILLLILSASMSTLSGLVLVSSSAIAIDFYQGRNPSEERRKNALVIMRLLCVVFVMASVAIALFKFTVIVNLMSISWGAVAGCFLAPYLYGLFWRRGTKAAVWVSMICALTITIIGYFKFGKNMSPVYGSISMVAPLVIFPIFSLITRRLPENHIQHVFSYKDVNGD